MKTVWSAEIDEMLKVGRFMDDVGICNWALTKGQALSVIDLLNSAHVPILGGDVYEIADETLQPTYDNWSCDQLPYEDMNAFLARSISTARTYIEKYVGTGQQSLLFVLVPSV